MRQDWIVRDGMWLCPHCHQRSEVVCAWVVNGNTNPSLACPVCGWEHMASQWCKVKCPEGCLYVQHKGEYEKRNCGSG